MLVSRATPIASDATGDSPPDASRLVRQRPALSASTPNLTTEPTSVRPSARPSARTSVRNGRPARFEPLRRPRDFQAAFRRGRRSRQPLLAMVARPNDLDLGFDRDDGLPRRVGFAISRRVGGAVVRNRVRRRLRALLRALPIEAGTDLVITAHPAAAAATFEELRRDLEACASACRILEAGDPRGGLLEGGHR